MYHITELAGKGGDLSYGFKRLFFSMHFKVKDNAFKYAAQTWERVVKSRHAFDYSKDEFLSFELSTEGDFKTHWRTVNDRARTGNYAVWAGHLLTHASIQDNHNDGIEFRSDVGEDGTLKSSEIAPLPVLPWRPESFLVLAGCNTGLSRVGWNPGAAFAQHQKVTTLGQTGYAYFSKKWHDFSSKTNETEICLWAYSRGKNSWFGSGGRLAGRVFNA